METLLSLAHALIHVLVAATLPPLLLGVINRVKAVFAGRSGQPLLQPYYDLARLTRKSFVVSQTTTWVFRAGPVVGLAAIASALLFVPLGNHDSPVSFAGDLVLVVYLLGLARFATAAAALDVGSSFEGMGAAREVTFGCLAEPAFFFGLLVVAKLSGKMALSAMLRGALAADWAVAAAPLVLVGLCWFIVLLVENSRMPFDDPNTHLELTMVHEVMVLDHSGPALCMAMYAAALKLFLFGALIVRLAVPWSVGDPFADWLLFVAGMLGLAAVVGVVESVMARLRLPAIPQVLVAAGLLAAFSLVILAR
jgi:formate hydrogenlyase subunit 4